MQQFESNVQKICRILDRVAGICIFLTMLLVVANILLRECFNRPIVGAYEMVCMLTAAAIGLAVAHCALQEGHIAVDYLVNMLSDAQRRLIAVITNFLGFTFWALVTFCLLRYGISMINNGMVSATMQIPLAPFVFLIALGFLVLCLVLFSKMGALIVIKEKSLGWAPDKIKAWARSAQ
ncbi:MAG: TRAP transporter small permease [Syntrophomonadaceae bacterium]|jgi:TRAP-type C4-dicarboxylate transport system permease small subunit